jgi:hypothetical protein
MTTAGQVQLFTADGVDVPLGITAGPDGALWFTNQKDDSIGCITTAGAITIFGSPEVDGPRGINVGPDGNLWFASLVNDRIGRIEPGCPSAAGTTAPPTTAPATTAPPTTVAGGTPTTVVPGATTTTPIPSTTTGGVTTSTIPTITGLVRTGADLGELTVAALLFVLLGGALAVSGRWPRLAPAPGRGSGRRSDWLRRRRRGARRPTGGRRWRR